MRGLGRAPVTISGATLEPRYPGRHRIDVLVNGVAHPLAEFEVRR